MGPSGRGLPAGGCQPAHASGQPGAQCASGYKPWEQLARTTSVRVVSASFLQAARRGSIVAVSCLHGRSVLLRCGQNVVIGAVVAQSLDFARRCWVGTPRCGWAVAACCAPRTPTFRVVRSCANDAIRAHEIAVNLVMLCVHCMRCACSGMEEALSVQSFALNLSLSEIR